MARGLLLLAVGVAAGCSGDPPPIVEAKPVGGEKPVEVAFQPPARPDRSDPAAAKLLADALAAHTGNDLGKLEKLKAVSLHRTALARTQDAARCPLDWKADLAPGRYRAEAVLRHPRTLHRFTAVVGPDGGSESSPGPDGRPVKVAIEGETLVDCHRQRAEDELLLLYPLADKSTVAVPAPEQDVNGKPAAGAYVWTPALAPALVHFDKQTGRLVRLVYTGRENRTDVPKELTIRADAQFGGVWLPSSYLLRVKGAEFMDVERQTYELGRTFAPDRFKP